MTVLDRQNRTVASFFTEQPRWIKACAQCDLVVEHLIVNGPCAYAEASLPMTWLNTVHLGDSSNMREIPDESIDALVTDPPYNLHFMGREWDKNSVAFTAEYWKEQMRVMKPGAHLLAFGGTRTYHRLVVAIEDAGFEIRDCVNWLYASGFPKSLDVSAAIDKAAGAERVVTGVKPGHESFVGRDNMKSLREGTLSGDGGYHRPWMDDPEKVLAAHMSTGPATAEAKQWDGWGTALKPACELIVLARKPLSEKNVAANVLRYGTGALNIDASRIGHGADVDLTHVQRQRSDSAGFGSSGYKADHEQPSYNAAGRWPANVLLSHNPDCEQIGTRIVAGDQRDEAGWNGAARPNQFGDATGMFGGGEERRPQRERGKREAGFFDVGSENGDGGPAGGVYGNEEVPIYRCTEGCAVAALDAQSGILSSGEPSGEPSGERASGIGYGRGWPEGGGVPVTGYGDKGGASRFFFVAKPSKAEKNANIADDTVKQNHPTVKPIDLMCYLIRLITPPGGVILDPFAGSGTTLVAAESLGFKWVGYEREPEYHKIAMGRLSQRSLFNA